MADIIILGVFVADAAYRCTRMPVVGETRVLPETLQQTYDRLKAHLDK